MKNLFIQKSFKIFSKQIAFQTPFWVHIQDWFSSTSKLTIRTLLESTLFHNISSNCMTDCWRVMQFHPKGGSPRNQFHERCSAPRTCNLCFLLIYSVFDFSQRCLKTHRKLHIPSKIYKALNCLISMDSKLEKKFNRISLRLEIQ